MIKTIISAAIIIGASFSACTNQDKRDEQREKVDVTANKKEDHMKNLISIVEIPTADIGRAIAFYQAVLDVKIEKAEMGGVRMGVFPADGNTVNVVLVNGNDYKPSMQGPIVYLNAGDDLQITLDKIERNGGKVIVPKSEISPEMGYFAMFTDTEGNKLGLHSSH